MMVRLLLLIVVALPLAAKEKLPAPRPLSPAEEGAAAALAHYLSGGPEAVLSDVATSSPLRGLDRADALAEIEVRLGPVKGAKWHLDTVMPSLAEHAAAFSVVFSSGIDDSVLFEMARDGGRWRVVNLRTLGEPVTRPPLLGAAVPQTPHEAPEPPGLPEPLTDQRVALAIALPALALTIQAVAMRSRAQGAAKTILALMPLPLIAATAIILVPLYGRQTASRKPRPNSATNEKMTRLGSLVVLRRSVAAGEESPLRADPLPASGNVADTAALWNVQLLLMQERIDDASRILDRLPHPSNIPLAELLRARIAWAKKKDVDVVLAYEHAIDLGPGRDILLIEAAEMLAIAGFDERGERYLRRVAEVGSREPGVFYFMSALSGGDGDILGAGRYLTTAWRMQPVERAALYRNPAFWLIVRQPDVHKMLQPHLAEEPAFASTPSTRPLLVSGARSMVMGNDLRLVAGDAELDVPAGASIAPAGAEVIDAIAARREREQSALADLPLLLRDVRSSAALLQPSVRSRCLTTAVALAGRNRWRDVVALTEPFSPGDERTPLALSILRGAALTRLGDMSALRQLVQGILRNPSLKRKRDPHALVEVAELLAAIDEYDGAIRLLERARAEVELPGTPQRIEQLTLERQLASSYSSLPSEHFNIRYPKEVPPERAKRIAEILEAELARVRGSWFPGLRPKRITVDILSWEDFRRYTGNEYIAGLFTNKILLPIARVPVFPPPIVGLMTHELTHALLADATNNLAPRWFHEALATHMEMNETSRNAFQIYRDEHFLTVSLLDAVADGSPDPELVFEAYEIGDTTLRFIEAKYGRSALQTMIAAFRAGAGTDEAVRAATGKRVSDLDRLAREWGAAQPTLFTNRVIRYDGVTREPDGRVKVQN